MRVAVTGARGCNTVLEVQTVFIFEKVVFYNGYLSAFGNGNGDLVIVYRHDIEYDGIFSVEELKLFEIKFVFHGMPP